MYTLFGQDFLWPPVRKSADIRKEDIKATCVLINEGGYIALISRDGYVALVKNVSNEMKNARWDSEPARQK